MPLEKPEPTLEEQKKQEEAQEHPRLKAMKEIAERRRAEVDAESKESFPVTNDAGEVVEPSEEKEKSLEEAGKEADAAAEAEEAKEASTPPPSEPTPPPAAFDPNAEYELEVEGQKVKVKGDKIIERGRQAIQKEVAADYKLQLASELLEEAKRKVAAPSEPPVAPSEPKPPTDNDAAKLAEAIQFGTKEQATEAIKQLRTSGKATTPEEIMGFVSRNIGPMVSAQIEFQSAVDMVKRDYSDLMSNDYLKRLFFVEENRRRAPKDRGGEGDQRSWSDLYRAIGDDLRKTFNLKAPSAPAAPADSLAGKREAKAKAPVVPSPASARVEGKQPEKPPTTGEVLDKMRAARYQQPLNSERR